MLLLFNDNILRYSCATTCVVSPITPGKLPGFFGLNILFPATVTISHPSSPNVPVVVIGPPVIPSVVFICVTVPPLPTILDCGTQVILLAPSVTNT